MPIAVAAALSHLAGDARGISILAGLAGVYWVLAWATLGGSLGQRALGLRVVRAADGGTPEIGRAVLRFAAYVVALVPLGVGLIWAGFDAEKQGWHDKIAGTFVVRRL